jgi:hypothetical protein
MKGYNAKSAERKGASGEIQRELACVPRSPLLVIYTDLPGSSRKEL